MKCRHRPVVSGKPTVHLVCHRRRHVLHFLRNPVYDEQPIDELRVAVFLFPSTRVFSVFVQPLMTKRIDTMRRTPARELEKRRRGVIIRDGETQEGVCVFIREEATDVGRRLQDSFPHTPRLRASEPTRPCVVCVNRRCALHYYSCNLLAPHDVLLSRVPVFAVTTRLRHRLPT